MVGPGRSPTRRARTKACSPRAPAATSGLLLPSGGSEGGYTGYAPALLFGLRAVSVNGAPMGRDVIIFTADDASVTNPGHTIVATAPAAFGDPDEFRRRVDRVV